ncbi:MAG: hypothetical protein KKG75_05575 [Nanoarchaeota archaeon]|nr:hypothetical protein [Nanoarchaeota archaeon]
MENETKYSLIIVGVALVALVAFNYNDFFTGQTIVKNVPTTFQQERLAYVRILDIPSQIFLGERLDIWYISNNPNDLIQTNKEKIVIYNVDSVEPRMKKQLTYPKCMERHSATCEYREQAEQTFSIPVSWERGRYMVQIEREAREDGKYVKEIIGRGFLNII